VRWGSKPDGVCLVVGTLGSGFTNNNTADVILTNTPLQPEEAPFNLWVLGGWGPLWPRLSCGRGAVRCMRGPVRWHGFGCLGGCGGKGGKGRGGGAGWLLVGP
jgi:hypothetical protein